jgi:hypothetical protein
MAVAMVHLELQHIHAVHGPEDAPMTTLKVDIKDRLSGG